MLDFISVELNCDPDRILSNPNLRFFVLRDEDTGEEWERYGYACKIAEISTSLKIAVKTNLSSDNVKIYLTGSIHKHIHGNKNYTDLTLQELTMEIIALCDFLGIAPQNCLLHSFEFGVNLLLSHRTKDILDSILTCRYWEAERNNYRGKGYLKRFSLSQHEIKIYDKGKQCRLLEDHLRFEIKVLKMQYVQSKGLQISTLEDLLKPQIYNKLGELLISNIESLYFFDYRIDPEHIKNLPERKVLVEGSNPAFWAKFKDRCSDTAYKNKVKRFRELVIKHSPADLKSYFKTMVLNKWNELLNSCPKLPHVEKKIVPHYYPHIVCNFGGMFSSQYAHVWQKTLPINIRGP